MKIRDADFNAYAAARRTTFAAREALFFAADDGRVAFDKALDTYKEAIKAEDAAYVVYNNAPDANYIMEV